MALERQNERQSAAQRCLWCRTPIAGEETHCAKCGAAIPLRNVRSVEVRCRYCGAIYLRGFVACPSCREATPNYDGSGSVRLCRLCGAMAARAEPCPSCGDPPDAAIWPPPIFQDIRQPRPSQPALLTGIFGGDLVAGFLVVALISFAADSMTLQLVDRILARVAVPLTWLLQCFVWRRVTKSLKPHYPHVVEGIWWGWWLFLLVSAPLCWVVWF